MTVSFSVKDLFCKTIRKEASAEGILHVDWCKNKTTAVRVKCE